MISEIGNISTDKYVVQVLKFSNKRIITCKQYSTPMAVQNDLFISLDFLK